MRTAQQAIPLRMLQAIKKIVPIFNELRRTCWTRPEPCVALMIGDSIVAARENAVNPNKRPRNFLSSFIDIPGRWVAQNTGVPGQRQSIFTGGYNREDDWWA
jgi:hypothetical protein